MMGSISALYPLLLAALCVGYGLAKNAKKRTETAIRTIPFVATQTPGLRECQDLPPSFEEIVERCRSMKQTGGIR